jgi:hypothetical protein
MSSSSITPHISQSCDVISQFPPQICFDGHCRELGCEGIDCFVWEVADSGAREDGEFCEDAGRVLLAYSVEGLEGFLGGC